MPNTEIKLSKEDRTLLVKKYFEENNFVQSNIESFNDFIERRLQKIIDEVAEATPSVIPPEAEEVKVVFGKIRVEKPTLIEADGTRWKILPAESRMSLPKEAAICFFTGLSSKSWCTILSASIALQPNLTNSLVTVLLPEPIPPKIPIIGFFACLFTAEV
jgi:hypothetical protein